MLRLCAHVHRLHHRVEQTSRSVAEEVSRLIVDIQLTHRRELSRSNAGQLCRIMVARLASVKLESVKVQTIVVAAHKQELFVCEDVIFVGSLLFVAFFDS